MCCTDATLVTGLSLRQVIMAINGGTTEMKVSLWLAGKMQSSSVNKVLLSNLPAR